MNRSVFPYETKNYIAMVCRTFGREPWYCGCGIMYMEAHVADEPITYRYADKKTLQLASIVAAYRKGKTDYGSIVKLLYLADRLSIKRRGFPITGDLMYSMRHGFVLSRVLNRLRYIESSPDEWQHVFRRVRNHVIELIGDAGKGELSPADVKILEEILAEHGNKSFGQFRRLMHNRELFPEYTDVEEGGREEVDPREILRDSSVSEEDIAAIALDARAESLAHAHDFD